MALMLRHMGVKAISINGKMTQSNRIGALNKFKSGERNILIATDVASRGIDIPNVDLIINYDIPQQTKDYIHRVGRTARAGKSGRSITFVTQYDVENFQKIEHLIEKKLELYPTEENHVLSLHERVLEAARFAKQEIKEIKTNIQRSIKISLYHTQQILSKMQQVNDRISRTIAYMKKHNHLNKLKKN